MGGRHRGSKLEGHLPLLSSSLWFIHLFTCLSLALPVGFPLYSVPVSMWCLICKHLFFEVVRGLSLPLYPLFCGPGSMGIYYSAWLCSFLFLHISVLQECNMIYLSPLPLTGHNTWHPQLKGERLILQFQSLLGRLFCRNRMVEGGGIGKGAQPMVVRKQRQKRRALLCPSVMLCLSWSCPSMDCNPLLSCVCGILCLCNEDYDWDMPYFQAGPTAHSSNELITGWIYWWL